MNPFVELETQGDIATCLCYFSMLPHAETARVKSNIEKHCSHHHSWAALESYIKEHWFRTHIYTKLKKFLSAQQFEQQLLAQQ